MSISSERAPEPLGAYPHAKRVGNLLFLSGIGPRKRGSQDIPGVVIDASGNVSSYDIAAQCESCFENVAVIIEDAGAKWEDIADVLVFLTNMDDFAKYNEVYARWFAGPPGDGKPNPTRTTVEVSALPATIMVEVKVVVEMWGKSES